MVDLEKAVINWIAAKIKSNADLKKAMQIGSDSHSSYGIFEYIDSNGLRRTNIFERYTKCMLAEQKSFGLTEDEIELLEDFNYDRWDERLQDAIDDYNDDLRAIKELEEKWE